MTISSLTQQKMSQPDGKIPNDNPMSNLRSMLPTILINAVVPFLINQLAQPYMSTIDALLLASAVPALFTLGSLIIKRRIDMVGLLVVVGLVFTAIFALLFKSPRLLLLQGSIVTGLFGLALLLSLLLPRPLLFYLSRSMMAQNDAKRFARFNADWSIPQIRSHYRILSAAWGCVTLTQFLLSAVLAFTLPISLMLIISPVLSFVFVIPMVSWSIHTARKNKTLFDQLRLQQEANITATTYPDNSYEANCG